MSDTILFNTLGFSWQRSRIPAAKAQEFNEKMVRFYLTKNADDMLQFLIDCYPKND